MFPNSIHFNLHNERCSQQSSKFRRNYLSNFHMIIFSAAVSADVSPPLADDSAAFSAAVTADISPPLAELVRLWWMTLRLAC